MMTILLRFAFFHESIEKTQIEKALLLQDFQKMRGPFFDKNVRKTDLIQSNVARVLLPEIQAFFESEDGQREYAEWKAKQQAEQQK